MSDAVLGIAAELSVEPVLQKLVHAARGLVGARYAAIGIPDDAGGFARFLTSGMTERQIEAIGPLPRTHGLLGAMLEDPAPFRTADIRTDPRFWGWPSAHPAMGSFLGVPIVAKGDVVGAFYLTDKLGAPVFSDRDQELIQLLAAHAAIALENARLFERSRELSVLEERERLARELHDAMSQTLFSLTLTAESAVSLVRSDPEKAEAQIRGVQRLAREVTSELRTLVLELRPAQLASDGLVATLRTHVDVLRRARGVEVELEVEGERRLDSEAEPEVLRIVQEALHNALRHANAERVTVRLALDGQPVSVTVSDDGTGFDPHAPGVRSRRLGLTSMRERAATLGGRLTITSEAGQGTEVRLELPDA
ncbi:MAG: GAF domain-containing protein [Nitriliruptorales bacterium]|nr:GAF domain-containing protein [Nitriliruptorales bacterium]